MDTTELSFASVAIFFLCLIFFLLPGVLYSFFSMLREQEQSWSQDFAKGQTLGEFHPYGRLFNDPIHGAEAFSLGRKKREVADQELKNFGFFLMETMGPRFWIGWRKPGLGLFWYVADKETFVSCDEGIKPTLFNSSDEAIDAAIFVAYKAIHYYAEKKMIMGGM